MIKVAITGIMGSGKSTLSRMIRDLGYTVADCDEISHQIMLKGEAGYRQCVDTFGERILQPDGEIDRKKLASIVFADELSRKKLESITHPQIRLKLDQSCSCCSDPLWFAEVPLLFEAGMDSDYDEIITVSAPLELLLERLNRGRGYSREQALARLATQMSQQEKVSRSTLEVVNDGDLEKMERQIRTWIKEKLYGTEG